MLACLKLAFRSATRPSLSPRGDALRFNVRANSTSPTLHPASGLRRDKLSITSLLDLPDEPPSPDLPAPYIVASEFQSYIWPLYSRRWTIKFTSREHVILDGELFGEKYSTPYLDRRYLIPTNVEAVKFLEGIREIVASDKHEPFLAFRTGLNRRRSMSVEISTLQTQGSPSLFDPAFLRVGSGITLRDVRLAIQVEKLYYKMYRPLRKYHVLPGTPMSIERVMDEHAIINQYLLKTLLRRQVSPEHVQFSAPSPPTPILPHLEAPDAFCTDLDFSRTIVPLYARGWCIVFQNRLQRSDGEIKPLKIPTLTGFYKFTSFDHTISFAQDVITMLGGNEGCDILVSAQTVTVQPLSQETEQEITIRDARNAVLVESLFEDKYRALARDSSVPAMAHISRPTSTTDLKLDPSSTPTLAHWNRAAKAARSTRRVVHMPRETEQPIKP